MITEKNIQKLEEKTIEATMLQDEETQEEEKVNYPQSQEENIAGIDIQTPQFLKKAFSKTKKFLSDFTKDNSEESISINTETPEILDPNNPIAINLPSNLTSPHSLDEEDDIKQFSDLFSKSIKIRIADQKVLQFVKTIYGISTIRTALLLFFAYLIEIRNYVEGFLLWSAISLIITHCIHKYKKFLTAGENVVLIIFCFVFDSAISLLLHACVRDILWYREFLYISLVFSTICFVSCSPFVQSGLPIVLNGLKIAKLTLLVSAIILFFLYPQSHFFSARNFSLFKTVFIFVVLFPIYGFGAQLQFKILKERLYMNMDTITWKDCVVLASTLRYAAFQKFWKIATSG